MSGSLRGGGFFLTHTVDYTNILLISTTLKYQSATKAHLPVIFSHKTHTHLTFLNIFTGFLLSSTLNSNLPCWVLTHNTLCSTQPVYLLSFLNYHTLTRSLPSANTNLLSVPRVCNNFTSRGLMQPLQSGIHFRLAFVILPLPILYVAFLKLSCLSVSENRLSLKEKRFH